MNIPIIIICYNNYKYVENTIQQIRRINKRCTSQNKSDCAEYTSESKSDCMEHKSENKSDCVEHTSDNKSDCVEYTSENKSNSVEHTSENKSDCEEHTVPNKTDCVEHTAPNESDCTEYNNIQILDNCSTCSDTINFLKNIDVKVIYNDTNSGPWILPNNNAHIYNILPNKFILTDPDLEFNENLPTNFIEILANLSDKYNCNKIGFALDISDFDKMYNCAYCHNKNIYDWEIQWWNNKIDDNDYELYHSCIDTTFSLINKKYHNENHHSNCVRIAGNFTAKHLPWYKDNKVYTVYENYLINKNTTSISTIANIIVSHIDRTYSKIYKNKEFFFIENKTGDPNLHFWKNIFTNWENETFDVFDKLLDKNKIFIDIGAWIGTTSMYGSRKSKHVYCIEADNKAFNDMASNLKINCENNYTLINKAIYNINDNDIKFGKNKFLNNSKMNDSTSQIYNDNETSDEFYLIKTITLQNIIETNNINPTEISLIKVDIEGGEEYILNDLYDVYKKYNVPLYISFHYTWWKDKNLERFVFLTEIQKQNIIGNPFTSILLNL